MNFILDFLIKKVGVVNLLSIVWKRAEPILRKKAEETPSEVDNVIIDMVDDALCKFAGVCSTENKG